MAFARAKFGIEYNPRRPEGDETFPWAVAIVSLLVLFLVSYTAVRISRALSGDGNPAENIEQAADGGDEEPGEVAVAAARPQPPAPVAMPATPGAKRPAKARTLLDKLAKAEEMRDIEMAIDTIEQLRNLPGEPVADLDDKLARRLGTLNLRKLYTLKSRQWVTEVTARRGDNMARIAREHGATLASTVKLNGGDSVKAGAKILVMDHPQFRLVIHSAPRYADLFFMGKFFKRYYLEPGTVDNASVPALKSIPFKSADREELETLLPASTVILVSEI